MDKSKEKIEIPTIKIAFFDVGQGDTIVISSPDTNEAIVVDCVDEKAVLKYLKQEHITRLLGVVVTHLHEDHYRGVLRLLKNWRRVPNMKECEKLTINPIYPVSSRIRQELLRDADNHSSSDSNRAILTRWSNLVEWCEDNWRKCTTITAENKLPFAGKLTQALTLLYPRNVDLLNLEKTGLNLNNTSVVLHVQGRGGSALLTGDIEPLGWEQILSLHSNIQCDVLKFPHHGGAWDYENGKKILNALNPSLVVISVGTGNQNRRNSNRYDHPNQGVLDLIGEQTLSAVHLLCTQATSKCNDELLNSDQRKAIRKSVVKTYNREAKRNNHFPFISKLGCPCAGTVIVELGDQVRLLHPNSELHREKIIGNYYNSGNHCVICENK